MKTCMCRHGAELHHADALACMIDVCDCAKYDQAISRRMVAAYLLDRADQYQDGSASWIGLADAARAVVRGEADDAIDCGELDDSQVLTRIDRMAK